ncbi:MAG: recombinase family protein [Planctomycetota bacterium]
MSKRRKRKQDEAPPDVRCAVYTRKSTDEGLEQEFNSLDAQREAAESYIASQKAKGWVCLPDHYDDGGFTGGNMNRPALQRLMSDIQGGKVDCVVVYKVDRLSRSLLDFARLIGTFDEHRVSLVSVTQQLNTTSSMGRLTLNILLSFAQFEREMISERTRDKMHAARKKGKWIGGWPMLGYDVHPRGGRLVVNEAEAAKVRSIFETYLDRQSLTETAKELDRRGWTNKEWVTRKGHKAGGGVFTKTSVSKLLTNMVYIGKVSFRGEIYEGEHEAIVSKELWDRVQAILRRNMNSGGQHVRNKHGALLKGLLYCGSCDTAMTHSHTTKRNKVYRYYVCTTAQKRGWETCPTKSIPAPEIERFVVDRIRCIGQDPDIFAETLEQARAQNQESVQKLEAERRGLQRDLTRHNARVRELISKTATNGDGTSPETAQLADLQERIRAAEQRGTQIREELLELSRELVDERELANALSLFDPIWDTLAPREQVRAVRLLVERVVYDGEAGKVAITFRPTGIRALANEAATEEEDDT